MPAHYHLRCLGPPVLIGPNGEPIRLKTRKHFALLIYLAVEPEQAHRRERLADLLWPRVGGTEARHSVATAISMFRNRLGPRAVTADRDHVRLTVNGLTLDLTRLLRGEILGDEITPPLEIGSFLEDFDLDDAPEFMLWRDRQQARLFPAIREGLLLLIDRCRRTGNFRQIEVLADRLLAIDHLSEDGVRAKMEARAFDGDRLSALRIYEQWRDQLTEQLGAVPSIQVEGIAMRLRRRGWERTTAVGIPTVPTDHWRGHWFVGRAREYRALYENWEQTARGISANALILGDSGVGKTTLADRLITATGLEGAVTVRVQCYELDREIPYAALAGLVRGLLERPGSTGTRPEALADLSLCMPEIRHRYPDLPHAAFSDGEGVRVQLAEGAHELLTAVAEENPVILVVDDLHLADDASIAVLNLVLRRTATQPIMLVLTARPNELERSPSARRVREGAVALRLTTIEVPPMSEGESLELLAGLLEVADPQPNTAERRALLAAAAGYPMVLELFVRDWMANGRRAMALTLGAMTPELGHARAAEHTYKALIDRIIHELPSEVRGVLNLAAILGNRLNDLEMYQLVDLTLARTMTGMTVLNDLRLLRDNGRELGFRNELIRAQAYMNVPSTLRRALHGRVAERLIAGQSDRPPTGLELAWHCFRAGRTDEARGYLISGAREAIDDGAVCEAELALVSGMPLMPEPQKTEAMLLAAEALRDQGRWVESLGMLPSTDTSHDPDAQSRHAALETSALWKLAQLGEQDLSARLNKLLLDLATARSPNAKYLALETFAMILSDKQDRETSIEAFRCLKAIAANKESRRELAAHAFAWAVASHFAESTEDHPVAERQLEAALQMYGETSQGQGLVGLLMALGSFKTSRGKYEEAIPYFERARGAAERLGTPTGIARAISNLMMSQVRIGQYDKVFQLASQGLEAASTSKDLTGFRIVCHLAWSHAMIGENERARTLIQDRSDYFNWGLPSWAIQAANLCLADVHLLMHSAKASQEHSHRATFGAFAEPLSRSYVGPFVRAVARLGLINQDEEGALERVKRAELSYNCDLIDRAEIACAEIKLNLALNREPVEASATLRTALRRLPESTTTTLQRLELGQSLQYSAGPP